MPLEHHATQTGLAALTVRAPAAAPRFSFHSGYYCEACNHEGTDAHASLADSCSEAAAMCSACCTFDRLEVAGDRVTRRGAKCDEPCCDARLRDGAWIVADRAESFALCFRCAVSDVIENAPLTTCVDAVNIVGGEPTLNDVLAVLGYRTEHVAKGNGYRKNILSSFGNVLLANVTAAETWAWLAAQGVHIRAAGYKRVSRVAAVAFTVEALKPAVAEALRLRLELLAESAPSRAIIIDACSCDQCASLEDEVA